MFRLELSGAAVGAERNRSTANAELINIRLTP